MVDNNCRLFAYAMAQFMGVAEKYKQVAKSYFFSMEEEVVIKPPFMGGME